MPVSTRHSNPIGHRYHDENECYIWTSKLAMTRFLEKQGSTITSLSSVTPAITLCILHVVGTWLIFRMFAPPPRWPARLAPTTCGRERVNMGRDCSLTMLKTERRSDSNWGRRTFHIGMNRFMYLWSSMIRSPFILFSGKWKSRRLLREFS